jgi:NADPH:quinone reductase-like Zn-dependent oxidoreductase
MKAVVGERFGPPEVLELRDLPLPEIEPHQVLVRVHASSVNPAEWYRVNGPFFIRVLGEGLRRPKVPAVGSDVAGTVEAVGADVTTLEPGDEVFGTAVGAWAEYAAAREIRIVRKPPSVSFEDAAAAPIAGLTALQALRDHGAVQPGQKVLINGASGGVGTYAVQLAKVMGADVTAVCSTRNVELVCSLGADRVVDYAQEDFTRGAERHDVMLDVVGSRPFGAFARVLTPDAAVVVIGAPMSAKGLGPLKHLIGTRLKSIGSSRRVRVFIAKVNTDDLEVLGRHLADGTIRSVIDRRYPLAEISEALRHLGTTHARGKIVVTV